MTESLIQKIEDKVLLLLAEITNLRQEISHLKSENQELRSDQGNQVNKLKELVSLLDVLESDNIQETVKVETLSVVM
jgi:regulator of replication initiation timing